MGVGRELNQPGRESGNHMLDRLARTEWSGWAAKEDDAEEREDMEQQRECPWCGDPIPTLTVTGPDGCDVQCPSGCFCPPCAKVYDDIVEEEHSMSYDQEHIE